jgi:hypothetical protein
MQVWREDGVPADVPLFITESNISPQYSEAYMDLWSGLWLADYVGAFLANGGNAVYYFHYLPGEVAPGHNGSRGTFNFFSAGADLKPRQPLAQYFASQLINLQWLMPGDGEHRLFAASSDVDDGAGHTLVTAYPVLRPDGEWSVMIVNKDQENEHRVAIRFDDAARGRSGRFDGALTMSLFGKAQYQWHPELNGGTADPDGPIASSTLTADRRSTFVLPPASIVVLRGKVVMDSPADANAGR